MIKRPRILAGILLSACLLVGYAIVSTATTTPGPSAGGVGLSAAPAAPAVKTEDAQKRFQKAIQLHKAGKLDAALAEYRVVKKLMPKEPAVVMNMGMIYIEKKQFGNAESAFKQVIALDPKNAIAVEQVARLLIARDANSDALSYAKRLEKMKPKDFNAKFLTGIICLKMEDLAGGAEAFRAALHIKPNDKYALYNLANCYMGLKKYPQALETAEKLLKADPDEGQTRLMAGFAAEKTGDRAKAIKHYEAGSKIKGFEVPSLLSLASLYSTSAKDTDKAIAVLERVVKIDKSSFQVYMNLGRLQYSKQLYEDAVTSLTAAKKLKPADPHANVYLAMALVQTQKSDEAFDAAKVAMEGDPKDKMVLEVYGYIQEVRKQYDDALATYRNWEKLYPDDPTPNRKIGNVYLFQKKNDLCYKQFDTALKKAPNDLDMVLLYAETLGRNSQFARAYDLYKRAMDIKPGVARMMVEAAFCLQKQSKYDEAIALMKKAIEAAPKDTMSYTALAQLYEEQDKKDLAIEEYKRVLAFAPEDVRSLEALARIYDSQENYEGVIEVLRKLVEIEPESPRYATEIARIYDEKLGKTDTAIEECRNAMKNPAVEMACRNQLAKLLAKKGDLAGATEQYAAMAKSDESGVKVYAIEQLGDLQREQGKLDDALKSYKEALAIRPYNPAVLDSVSKIYEEKQKPDEFHSYLKSLIESGADGLPYSYYFATLNKAGKSDEAVEMLEKLAAGSPDNGQIRMALASAYSTIERKDQAIEEYKKLLAKNEDDPQVNRALGDVYKSMSRDKEALECFEKAAKSFFYDPQMLLDMGGIYEKFDRKSDAVKVYKDYLKFDPANSEIKKKVNALESSREPTASAPAPAPEGTAQPEPKPETPAAQPAQSDPATPADP